MKKKHLTALCCGAILVGLLLAAGRVLMSVACLQAGIEMYLRESPLPAVFHSILAAASVLAAGLGVYAGNGMKRKNGALHPGKASQAGTFAALLMGFMLLANGGLLVYEMARNGWADIGPLLGIQVAGVTFASAVFALLFVLAALPAAVYFLKTASADPAAVSAGYAICAVFPIIWFLLRALNAYFDSATAFNSPVKIVRILAILLFVLYAVQDARCILHIADPRLYCAFGFSAVVVGLTQAVSDGVIYAMQGIHLKDGYLGATLEIVYVLYIVTRILSVSAEPEEQTSAGEPLPEPADDSDTTEQP